ncbi:protease modulator HflC, partial [bacterium]
YQGETFLTSENKGLIVDFYVKWRINDIGRYYRTTGGLEATAGERLRETVTDGIKSVVAKRTLQDIVIAERAAFTDEMFERASTAVQELGVQLIDVRVQRIDLPDEVSGSVYQRMQESFRALANRLRAEGSASAEKIRAEAERKRTEVLATAQRDAQRVRAESDAASAKIYSAAYGKSPEFYAFFRSLQAYRNSLGREGDVWVVEPEGEFFKYFKSPGKR